MIVGRHSVLLRAGTARLLEASGFDVVGRAGDRDDLLRKVRAHRPDVAVIDIRMAPDHHDAGLQAARIIRAELPGVGVLVLSAKLEERSALERFTAALERVAHRGAVLDPEVMAAMVRGRRAAFDALTARERDVLDELAAGRSNHGIAKARFLSERAVERHVTAILAKLDLPAGHRTHRRVLAFLAHRRAAAQRLRPSGPVSQRPSSCGSSSHASASLRPRSISARANSGAKKR
jgi:DNA-binding NarL/FixJ family response regulator